MSLREVIQSHYGTFSRDVSPVELASRLDDLTMSDREIIECRYRSCGRLQANHELFTAICGKVDWKDFYEALTKENCRHLAKILHDEYYKRNPTAQPIVYNEPLESQVAEGDTKCAEFIPEASSSNEKTSPKIHVNCKTNVSNSSCNKDSTTSKSQPPMSIINNYTIYAGDIINSNVQIGDENQIIYDKPEESVEDETETTYEFEIVPEVLENQSSSEIHTERSPDLQNIPSGRQLVEQQSIADDASRTSNLPSTNNSIFRSAAHERADTNDSQTLLKTSATSEIECRQHVEKATSDNLSYSTSDLERRLGINFRHNEHSEGENHVDDSDDETYVKKIMSDD